GRVRSPSRRSGFVLRYVAAPPSASDRSRGGGTGRPSSGRSGGVEGQPRRDLSNGRTVASSERTRRRGGSSRDVVAQEPQASTSPFYTERRMSALALVSRHTSRTSRGSDRRVLGVHVC